LAQAEVGDLHDLAADRVDALVVAEQRGGSKYRGDHNSPAEVRAALIRSMAPRGV
jgi:hypothetical protein